MVERNLLGSKIRQVREMQKMSVQELADSSNTSNEPIVQLENGALVPPLATHMYMPVVMNLPRY